MNAVEKPHGSSNASRISPVMISAAIEESKEKLEQRKAQRIQKRTDFKEFIRLQKEAKVISHQFTSLTIM